MADATPPSVAPTPTPIPVRIKQSLSPGNGRRWDTIQLAIRLGCVVALTGAVVGFFCLSGRPITTEQIILIIMAGAALAGISMARPGGTGGSTGATLIGGSLLMLTMILGGCEGSQVPGTGCTQAVIRAASDIAAACWPRAEGEACPFEQEQPYDEQP